MIAADKGAHAHPNRRFIRASRPQHCFHTQETATPRLGSWHGDTLARRWIDSMFRCARHKRADGQLLEEAVENVKDAGLLGEVCRVARLKEAGHAPGLQMTLLLAVQDVPSPQRLTVPRVEGRVGWGALAGRKRCPLLGQRPLVPVLFRLHGEEESALRV